LAKPSWKWIRKWDTKLEFRKWLKRKPFFPGILTFCDLVFNIFTTDVFFSSPGENCEILLAPCSPRPCKNGGVCKEAEDYQSFSCICPEGWQGIYPFLHGHQQARAQTCLGGEGGGPKEGHLSPK